MSSFEAVEIPLSLIPEELWDAPVEELAFLIRFGNRICNSVEHTYASIDPAIVNTVPAPSAVIGQTGEEFVYNLYEEKYIVENVAKRGRAGDLFMWRCDPEGLEVTSTKLLIEVKNYQSPVATEQVEKFYRDLGANSSIVGGIFISLNTKIYGIGSKFKFCLRNRTPIVFVQSRDRDILMLAAELIWSYIDSRTAIDEEAFQKLSRKLTYLNDTLNGLSLARTFVTETRTIIDKQLNRIYESVFTAEMQMRAAISSISKTLREFTVRGGAIAAGDEVSQGQFQWEMLETLHEKYPNTAFANETHRETVLSLTDIIENGPGLTGDFSVRYEKKGIVIMRNGEPFIVLTLLKTRTDISFAIASDGLVKIPAFAAYKNGMVSFSIDKKYIKAGYHEKAVEFLDE